MLTVNSSRHAEVATEAWHNCIGKVFDAGWIMPLLYRATDMINASLGTDKVEFMELDVGSFEKIRSFVSKVRAKNHPINILVNNVIV